MGYHAEFDRGWSNDANITCRDKPEKMEGRVTVDLSRTVSEIKGDFGRKRIFPRILPGQIVENV